MKIKGFIIDEIEVGNAIVLCYKDYKMAKDVYDRLEEQKCKQNFFSHRVWLRFIWSLDLEYQYKIVVEFINRNKDIYAKPPKFPFEGTDLDEFEEWSFMNPVDIKECKIIYSGDVPEIK